MNIIITGASRGIGADMALQLASKANRLLLISRSADQVGQIADQCNQRAGSHVAYAVPSDLTSLIGGKSDLMERIYDCLDVIDVLVNNAGMVLRKSYEEITPEESKKIFDINYFAPAEFIRLCKPLMLKSKHPAIVNITSMGGVQGSSKFPGLSAYSASKGALSVLTECLAEEFAEDKIRVNALALGAVQTEMLAEAFPGFKAPLNAAEMGSFMKWFITEGSRFFNGKTLPVSVSTP